jgi:beta-glucosidase/6-phospho-beta-glucosidase/beta-galactosidase
VSFPDFAWSCGEEASDPLVLHDGAVVRVDELAMSGHLAQQDGDLAAVAALGVRVWRYGMPWRLVELSPGVYDWSLWDRALDACERHGLEPVVDLCHFGLPDHYAGFCHIEWVEGFVRYVEAFLARYRAPRWFTPVNEPSFTAVASALFGIWNDRRRSKRDWADALCHVVLANLEANARIRADRDGWWVGAESFTCPVAVSEAHAAEAERVRATAWAVWDLHFGMPLDPGVERDFDAVAAATRQRIDKLATKTNAIAGHDFYPVSVVPVGGSLDGWSTEQRLDAYETTARAWHARYGVDFWVAETSNLGLPVAQQEDWLAAFARRLRRMQERGLPVRGLCWYSRGDQYDWDSALATPVGRVTEVGLYTVQRRPRPAAALFRRLASRTE